MTAREWVDAYAAAIGSDPPSEEEFETILDLAAVAAHASHRTAAPVACWLAGASDRSLDELRAIAGRIAGRQGDDND